MANMYKIFDGVKSFFQKPNPEKKPQMGQITTSGSLNKLLSISKKMLQANPSKIKFKDFEEMRTHPTISFALDFVKAPIQTVNWQIKCDDEEKKKIIYNNINSLWNELIYDMLFAYDFGFSAFEKVWDIDNSTGLYFYKKLLNVHPKTIKISTTEDGSYNGFEQEAELGLGKSVYVKPDKSFIFTYKKEFGNYYGIPRTRPAYMAWYIFKYVIEFTNMYYEKFGEPTVVGYAPQGSSNREGELIDNMKIMEEIMNSIQNNTSVVLPHMVGKDGLRQFSLELLEAKRAGADYLQYLKYLDSLMMRAIILPDIAYSTEEKGSQSSFSERVALFAEINDALLKQIKYHIDKYIINPLIEINWGNTVKAEWVYQSQSTKDKELMRQLMHALIQMGNFDLPMTWLREQLQLPEIETGKTDPYGNIETPENKIIEKTKPTMASIHKTINFKRQPNNLESHVNFEKIKRRFDNAEQQTVDELNRIIEKQKSAMIDDIERIVESGNINNIQFLELKYQKEYEDNIVNIMKEMFEAGKEDVQHEHELGDLILPIAATDWIVTQAKNIAQKHINDLKFNIINSTMRNISKERTMKEILRDVRNEFDGYVESELEESSAMLVHKGYEDGREWTAEEGELPYAEWSAVLDNRVCEFCERRDGMVIRVDDPDFTEFSPADVHE